MTIRIRVPSLAFFALLFAAVAALLAGAFWAWREWHGESDLLLVNGRVFDGETFLPPRTRVAVRDGRIMEVGYLWGVRTRRVFDVEGAVIAPGFIDAHTHVERNIPLHAPFRAANFVRQGVATLITGNCGTSTLSVNDLFKRLEHGGSQVNVATLVGHNSLREEVMPGSAQAASADRVRRMSDILERNLAEGALGLSTGLAYAPGCFAREEEVIELARVAARHGGLYVTHLRDEGVGGQAALNEALRIRQAAQVHLHISHLKIAAPKDWGTSRNRLAQLEEARRTGPPITFDVYAYSASSTSTDILAPPEFRGKQVNWRRVLEDAAERERLNRGMLGQLHEAGFSDFSHARIASFWGNRALEGTSIPEAAAALNLKPPSAPQPPPAPKSRNSRNSRGDSRKAAARRLPESHTPAALRPQLDAVFYLLTRGGAQMIYEDMSESDVETFLRDPAGVFGTDSAVRYPGQDFAHPRGTGNFPRILGEFVRERGRLTLDEALRKMTSAPARIFNLPGRGRLAPGFQADITVFDAATVRARNDYSQPLTPPEGIRWVFVNGVEVLRDGEPTDALPGLPVRRGPGAANPARDKGERDLAR
ncbi:MAG: amidohydrolase family protein [Bryobacteraceae bacterium]|nr:amidohydrolase family protein [Bryobacteraceae bacterium]